ncbi:MAG TPA: hypothetical protein VLI68_05645 [Hanamia sp.]|jgi:amino acid transporter|nr:hypothetical protein [Hanamia sp.]
MKDKSNINGQPQKRFSAGKSILIGAAIGLILISLFVFEVKNPKPEWGKFWRVRPLLIEPLAGGIGGWFFYFMNYMGSKGAVNKTMAFVLSIVVFIMLLWLGIVFGLNGTIWK